MLERELELSRLKSTLDGLAKRRIVLTEPRRLTPLALPLIAAFYLMFTIESAYQHARGRGGNWKGRAYPAAVARRR